MGFGLLVLCVTGVVVWWPGILRWKRSLGVVARKLEARELGSALLVGFWCCAALLVVSFTGVYFAFPKIIGGLTLVCGSKRHQDNARTDGAL